MVHAQHLGSVRTQRRVVHLRRLHYRAESTGDVLPPEGVSWHGVPGTKLYAPERNVYLNDEFLLGETERRIQGGHVPRRPAPAGEQPEPDPALHVPVVEWWDQPEDPAVRWERPAGWTLPKAADLDYLLAECPSGPYRTRP